MKNTIFAVAALSFMMSFAKADDKKPQLTTSEAKEKCKKEGKQGQELIDCIKEKKGDK